MKHGTFAGRVRAPVTGTSIALSPSKKELKNDSPSHPTSRNCRTWRSASRKMPKRSAPKLGKSSMLAAKESARTSPSGWSGWNSNLQKAAEKGGPDFVAFREKVKGDRQRLKDKLSERKEAYSAFFADANDEERQLGAAIAIDYAIATVQQARLAVLDAVSDRAEARSGNAQPVA